MHPAIRVENLTKRYRLGSQVAGGLNLTERLTSALRFFRRSVAPSNNFTALDGVSFEVKAGEVVGVIGRNGAGKSTLLKILSRIVEPSDGRAELRGRVGSLLEVGTGFHPELTGRENVYLNGSVLGMTRREIARSFDEIVAFAGIEQFLDTPVKRYSSGMYVRLAFAVAAHLEPEILVVDEVLAVGDAEFQKKCLGKMGSFAQSGRTVLFVSHNMEAIRSLCQRGLWLKNGRLHQDGKVENVVEAYFNTVSAEQSFTFSNEDYGLTIHKVALKNARGQETAQFSPGDDLIVEISFDAKRRIERPILALGILGLNGSCFSSNMLLDGHRPNYLEGSGKITCIFKAIPLLPQNYTVKMIIRSSNVNDLILNYQEVAGFSVLGDLAEYGYRGDFLTYARSSTPVVVPYEWRLPDGTSATVGLNRPTFAGSSRD